MLVTFDAKDCHPQTCASMPSIEDYLFSTTLEAQVDLIVSVHWGMNELVVVIIHLAHKDKF